MEEFKKKVWEHILKGHDIEIIVYAEGDTKGHYTKAIPTDAITGFAVKCYECKEILLESERTVEQEF